MRQGDAAMVASGRELVPPFPDRPARCARFGVHRAGSVQSQRVEHVAEQQRRKHQHRNQDGKIDPAPRRHHLADRIRRHDLIGSETLIPETA